MVEEGSYAELQITLSCPEAKSPAISVSPDYIQTMAGENIIVEVSVTNEMSSVGCGTRTVNLEATLPNANWSAVFSPSSTLELGPGEEGNNHNGNLGSGKRNCRILQRRHQGYRPRLRIKRRIQSDH